MRGQRTKEEQKEREKIVILLKILISNNKNNAKQLKKELLLYSGLCFGYSFRINIPFTVRIGFWCFHILHRIACTTRSTTIQG